MTESRIDNPVTRAIRIPTRKNAISAMCAHCVGCTSSLQGNGFTDNLEAGFRASIAQCSATHCPLWDWRPFRSKEATDAP